MKAIRIHQFGPPEVLTLEELPKPEPGAGEVVVRVKSAGVGPWDALVRSGRSILAQPLPLIPGAEISGVVDSIGAGVEGFSIGDAVFGATNDRFTGGYAEYALASAATLAAKPKRLNDTHAASVPIAAATAWQMVFEAARIAQGQFVLIHGGAGNVGAFAVQMAKRAGATVTATASADDEGYVHRLGADGVMDYRKARFHERLKNVDAVLDTVGGEALARSYEVVRRGGVVVSVAERPAQAEAERRGVRALFFLVQITAVRLKQIAQWIDAGELKTEVGEVLWLDEARRGHEMLEGARHRRGKIVIKVAD